MSKITTDDCKKFLISTLNLVSNVNIKRERKYKDEAGDIIRQFLVDNTQTFYIKEDKNGTLSLISPESFSPKEKVFDAKKFLKKQLTKLEKRYEEDRFQDYDIVKEGNKLTADEKRKVANEFFYSFEPLCAEKDLSLTGLDTPIFSKDIVYPCILSIVFYDKLNSDPDLYLDEIVYSIIPNYLESVCENTYEIIKNDNTKDMTIRDVMNLFDSFGFKYKYYEDFFGEDDFMKNLESLK